MSRPMNQSSCLHMRSVQFQPTPRSLQGTHARFSARWRPSSDIRLRDAGSAETLQALQRHCLTSETLSLPVLRFASFEFPGERKAAVTCESRSLRRVSSKFGIGITLRLGYGSHAIFCVTLEKATIGLIGGFRAVAG